MCNAWNHSPSCTCGWGGIGHLGRRDHSGYAQFTGDANVYWYVPPIRATYESYVTPNASCPVCGASVFFYQSPYGGRVFFDELGPPWPKHPCTDNKNAFPEPKSISNPDTIVFSQRIYHWQVNGWLPYIISTVRQIDKYVVEINGTCNERTILVYISKSKLPVHDDPLHKESITQIRETTNGRFELSFITRAAKPYTINVFSMASHARPPYLLWPRVSHFIGYQPRTVSQGNRNRKKQTNLERHHPVSAANQNQENPLTPKKRKKQNDKVVRKDQDNSRSGNFAKTSITKTQPQHETQIARAFAAALRMPK